MRYQQKPVSKGKNSLTVIQLNKYNHVDVLGLKSSRLKGKRDSKTYRNKKSWN